MDRAVALLLCTTALLTSQRGVAQRLAPASVGVSFARSPDIRQTPAPRREPAMILGGVAGGAVGFLAGSIMGAAVALSGYDDGLAGLAGVTWGATAGVSMGIPLGVHMANRRRGNYATELGASLALAAVGMGLVSATDSGVPLLFVPVGQLVTSILIERATGR
ncbi:MAG: hypothetical protein ACM37V_10950 [Gemmatimonadota bacterium]